MVCYVIFYIIIIIYISAIYVCELEVNEKKLWLNFENKRGLKIIIEKNNQTNKIENEQT